jgi:hypothetical protein
MNIEFFFLNPKVFNLYSKLRYKNQCMFLVKYFSYLTSVCLVTIRTGEG